MGYIEHGNLRETAKQHFSLQLRYSARFGASESGLAIMQIDKPELLQIRTRPLDWQKLSREQTFAGKIEHTWDKSKGSPLASIPAVAGSRPGRILGKGVRQQGCRILHVGRDEIDNSNS